MIRINTVSLKLEELARALAVLRLASPERRCGISLACTRPSRCDEIQIDFTDPFVELSKHDRIWAKLQWICTSRWAARRSGFLGLPLESSDP